MDIVDGLADTCTWRDVIEKHNVELPTGSNLDECFIKILDPATGTGTFIVEVIDCIYKKKLSQWAEHDYDEDRMFKEWNKYVDKYLLDRINAFEIMVAPYAIAHMKIQLKLLSTGYKLSDVVPLKILLTNGIDFQGEAQGETMSLDLEVSPLSDESKKALDLKSGIPATVVLGNPPYSGESANNEIWAKKIVDGYRYINGKKLSLPQSKWLQNDYIKFIGLYESQLRKIPFGLICMITDHSFLDGDTYPGLRKALIDNHDSVYILDLHGNLNRRIERGIEKGDEGVFDIQQGTCISLVGRCGGVKNARGGELLATRAVKFNILSENTIHDLLVYDLDIQSYPYRFVKCLERNSIYAEFFSSPSVVDIFSLNGKPSPGFLTTHDKFAVSNSRDGIIENVQLLINSKNEEEARTKFKLCGTDQWDYLTAKKELKSTDWKKRIFKFLYRPFDRRYSVYDSNVLVHRRERVSDHMFENNLALLTTKVTKGDAYKHTYIADCPVEVIALSSKTSANCFVFPLYLYSSKEKIINLNSKVVDSLTVGFKQKPNEKDMFYYIYGVLNSHIYRDRYSEYLVSNFPIIPNFGSEEVFFKISNLGCKLAGAHLMDTKFTHDFDMFGDEFTVGPGMPKYDPNEQRMFINKSAGISGINESVYCYSIGSYQVLKKWLSSRKGMTLSKDDIHDLRKIVEAIIVSLGVTDEIDSIISKLKIWGS